MNIGVRHQRFAGVGRAGDDVQHAVGQAGFLSDFTQQQGGARCHFRRFDDRSAACGQRGADFPGRHQQRIIPRRNAGAHAARLAAQHRSVGAVVFAGAAAAGVARGGGEKAQVVYHKRQIAAFADKFIRLAGVFRFDFGQFIGARFDDIGHFPQHARALARRGLRPAPVVKRGFGRRHGGIHFLFAGGGHLRHGFACGRVFHIYRAAAGLPSAVNP